MEEKTKSIILIIVSFILFVGLLLFIIYVINYFKFPYLLYTDTNCLYKRFGCCSDKITPKLDQDGTNCRGF